MKKIAFIACIVCAVLFSGCNRPQHTYRTETVFSASMLLRPSDVTSTKAVLGTIKSYWDGEYAFKGNEVATTDLKALGKYTTSKSAILLHSNDIEKYMEEGDSFFYNLYRVSDNTLLISTQFYLDEDGDLDSEEILDNL